MELESDAVRVAREFREQLARNEDAALRKMSRYWVRMERELEPQFIALAQQIKEMEDRGQVVPPQYYYNLQRYQDLMAQILREVPDYEKYAVDIITDYQTENFTLGFDDASAVISASKPSDAMWNRVDRDAVQTVAGFAGNGAPLGELLRNDYGELGTEITDALVQGIGLGKGVSAIAKDMRDVMGKKAYARSVRIARTEVNRAYRIANAMQYEKSGVVTKVLRLCYKPTACFACLMLDGQECPKGICDDHPNGKCTTVAVTVGGIYPEWERGEDWFLQQSENDQRRIMGDGHYELWKKDNVPLRNMVEMKPNSVWGGSPSVISEKKLREQYNITGGNKVLFDVKPAPAEIQTISNKEQAKDALSKLFGSVEDKFMKNDENLIVRNTTQLLNLNKRFGAITSENQGFITNARSGRAIAWTSSLYRKDKEDTDLSLVGEYFKNPNVLKSSFERAQKKFFKMPANSENWDIYSVTHEYGHILQSYLSRKREDWDAIDAQISNFGVTEFSKIRKVYRDAEKKQAKIMYEEIIAIAKKNNPNFSLKDNLSGYGHTNHFEAFAEMFVNSQLGKPNELGRAMQEWLVKEGF